jgi:hypothetical protein
MSHQLGPSIVLSFLIVCFFAVALFQHDPPQKGDGSHFRAGSLTSSPGTLARAEKGDGSHFRAGSPASSAQKGDGSHFRAGSPASSAGTLATPPTETASSPRSAFTVVRAAETIEDVALRVYGTTAEADALWRANRDALPRRDCRLVAGMLLRTPRNAR